MSQYHTEFSHMPDISATANVVKLKDREGDIYTRLYNIDKHVQKDSLNRVKSEKFLSENMKKSKSITPEQEAEMIQR